MEGWRTLNPICSLSMDANEVFLPPWVLTSYSGGSKAFRSALCFLQYLCQQLSCLQVVLYAFKQKVRKRDQIQWLQ